MAEEDLIREEDVLAEGESGEEFLRHEEEEPEVVELPPNIQLMQGKIESLRQEIGNLEAQFAQVKDALDTRVAALSWYSEQIVKHFEVTSPADG
jgi:predicted  nucleic acid-binding Zn-ribbon protein